MKCSVTSCHACSTFDDGCSECGNGEIVRHPCPKVVRAARTGAPDAKQFIGENFPDLADGVDGDVVGRMLAHGEKELDRQRADDRLFLEVAYSEVALGVCTHLRSKFYSLTAEDAEDIVGDTFAAFANHVGQGKIDRDQWKGWIYAVARNKAKDMIKSARHRRTSWADSFDQPGRDLGAQARVPVAPSVEEVVISEYDALEVARASLFDDEQLIIEAHDQLVAKTGKRPSTREIARHLGLDANGQGNFHRKWNRIMAKLADHPAVKEEWGARRTGEQQ